MNGGLIRRGLVFAVILAVWGGQQIQGATTAGASNIQVSTVGTFTTYQVMHDLFSTSLNDLLPGGTTSHQKIAATPVLCATGVTYGATEKVPNGPTAGKVALYDEESAAPTIRGCIDFARSTTAPSSGTVSTHFDYYAFALDAVAPLVGSNAGGSSRSPVTLSLTDMKKIYLCRPGYTNWKTVTGPTAKPATGNNTQGGVTAPIVRFWPQAGSDTGSLYAAMLGFTPDATTYHTAAGSTCGSAAHPTADRPTSTFTTGLGAGKVNEENSEQGIIYASTTATLGDPAIADAIFIYSAGKFAEQWNTKTNYVSTKVNSISGTAIGNFKANTLLLAKMTNRATAATTKVFDTYGAPSGTFSPTSNRGSYTVNAAVVKESNEWYSHIASNSDGVTASTSPVPGVRYVYNVADSSLPTYGEAKMMIGFDNQASGAKSSLCNGDDAATIIAARPRPPEQRNHGPRHRRQGTCLLPRVSRKIVSRIGWFEELDLQHMGEPDNTAASTSTSSHRIRAGFTSGGRLWGRRHAGWSADGANTIGHPSTQREHRRCGVRIRGEHDVLALAGHLHPRHGRVRSDRPRDRRHLHRCAGSSRKRPRRQ